MENALDTYITMLHKFVFRKQLEILAHKHTDAFGRKKCFRCVPTYIYMNARNNAEAGRLTRGWNGFSMPLNVLTYALLQFSKLYLSGGDLLDSVHIIIATLMNIRGANSRTAWMCASLCCRYSN